MFTLYVVVFLVLVGSALGVCPSDVTFREIAPSGGFVASFAFHPTNPSTIYAGLDDSGGLWRSQDSGVTFSNVYMGRQNVAAWTIALHPQDPSKIYVGDAYGHGVFYSNNSGATWISLNNGLGSLPLNNTLGPLSLRIRSIAINPNSPSSIFIGTLSGLYSSSNGGQSWSPFGVGLPPGIVSQVNINASNPAIMYALTNGSIHRSNDFGSTWQLSFHPFSNNTVNDMWDFVFCSSHPSYAMVSGCTAGSTLNIACGVFQTTDGGNTWHDISPSQFSGLGILLLSATADYDQSNPSIIYAASYNVRARNMFATGRWKSTNGGASYVEVTPVSLGGKWEGAFRLRTNPHNSSVVFLGLGGEGIEVSFDAGGSWFRPTSGPSLSLTAGGIAVCQSNPLVIYAGGVLNSFSATKDGGNTWTRYPTPDLLLKVRVSPHNCSVVLAAPVFPFGLTDLWRSVDSGNSWTLSTIGPPNALVTNVIFDPTFAGVAYAMLVSPGIYRSNDFGASWSLLNGSISAVTMAKHPNNTAILLVGTLSGLYISDATQSQYSLVPSTAGFYIVYISVSANGLWVVGGGSAVYVSHNSGSSWSLYQFPNTQTVALQDPRIPDRVVVGASAVDVNFY